ncbi:MAG: plastocyanin/azurin family copper-binding protein [Acidimicrobiia bacterium]
MVRPMAALLAALALLAGACGSDDDDSGGDAAGGGARTVEVTMRDIDFDPAAVTVEAGETVRFVFVNEGALVHDAFLGDEAAQAEHGREAREHGEEAHGHGEGGTAITVDPGERGEITHTFTEPGELIIGCHEPGHYDAGMRIRVTVS